MIGLRDCIPKCFDLLKKNIKETGTYALLIDGRIVKYDYCVSKFFIQKHCSSYKKDSEFYNNPNTHGSFLGVGRVHSKDGCSQNSTTLCEFWRINE